MQMVKEGNEIQVICNNTKEDMTHKVLTQVIANDSMLVLGNVDVLTKMIRNVSNEEEIFKENKDAQKTT
jgi:polyhydroxyalkanoate synthesis regulator protein